MKDTSESRLHKVCRLSEHRAGQANTCHSLSLSENSVLITGRLFYFDTVTATEISSINVRLCWLGYPTAEYFCIVLRSVQLCCQFYWVSNEPRNKESVSRHNEFGL